MHDTDSFEKLYSAVTPSVVSLYVGDTDERRGGAGSGFVYERDDDAGYVVTNDHVLQAVHRDGRDGRPERRPIAEVDVRFADGQWRSGTVVGRDPDTDLAMVRVPTPPEAATPLPLADDRPTPGQPVAAFGNPMGLDGTISTGVVSGVNRSSPVGGGYTIPDTVQTDAPINPGNSGGPLVTVDGAVVGVNRARAGDNIGFAVSAAVARRVLPDLLADGETTHATLHVRTIDVSPTVATANDLPEPAGVLVVDVRPGPASGVLGGCVDTVAVDGHEVPVGGDVLIGIAAGDGPFTPLRSHEDLLRYLITEATPGDLVRLQVRRAAGDTEERVELAGREDPSPDRTSIELG